MVVNTVIDAIKTRRSVRSFQDKQIPEREIQTILEAGTYAPSGLNMQSWKFTIVTSKAEMKRLSDMTKPVLHRMLPDKGDERTMAFKKALATPEYNIFYNAPLLIIIAASKSHTSRDDCAAAAQNMMLAAHSLGIGSCWVGSTMAIANEASVKKELGVADDQEIFSTLIFGYPQGVQMRGPPRKPPEVLKRIV